MSLKKFTTSAAVIASLVAANMVPLATAASAHDRWSNGYDRGYDRDYDRGYGRGYDGSRRFSNDDHDYGPRYRYAKKRHNHGKDVAKGLAIGLGILAVGSIMAHNR